MMGRRRISAVAAAAAMALGGVLAAAPASQAAPVAPAAGTAAKGKTACVNPATGRIKLQSTRKARCRTGWIRVRLAHPAGKNGLNGKNGVNGRNGRDGRDGRDGTNGKDGQNGQNGLNGKDGKDGSPVLVKDSEGQVVGQYLTKIPLIPLLSVYQVLRNNGSYIYLETGEVMAGSLLGALAGSEREMIVYTNAGCTTTPSLHAGAGSEDLYGASVGSQGRFVARFDDNTVNAYKITATSTPVTTPTQLYVQDSAGVCVTSGGPVTDGALFALAGVAAPPDFSGPLVIDQP